MVRSSLANMVTLEQVRNEQRARGPATMLAIGTAVPSNCVDQSTYPDYYFRVTNSQHKTELKEKFERMCGPAILDRLETELGLKEGKLRASRKVLSNYGNVSGGSVYFIMDEMRRKSKEEGLKTTGEGLQWGVLFGFGPWLTLETVVLRSVAVAV